MNVEELIKEANPVQASDLPGGDSPHARRTLDKILEAPATAGRVRQSRRAWRRWMTTLAVMAAGAAVAVLVSVVPPQTAGTPSPRPKAAGTLPRGPGARAARAHPAAAPPVTARQILLLAADHVTAGPASGKYWRVQLAGGLTFPAGTTADRYDISVTTSADQWNPSSPGQKEWVISQQLGARPASPADAAAWRAAGSPATWHSGLPVRLKSAWRAGLPLDWMDTLAASTSPSGRTATWQVSDGTVGYVEGDLPGLDSAQFRQIPTSQRAISALLRHYYHQLRFCAQNPGQCSTEDQVIWAEAVMLLQDPISAQARAATFRVMAALPGVRSLGPMTDPLGRNGYALAPGGQSPNAVPGNYNPLKVILIDPLTGSVLATEEIGPMPRTLRCLSWDNSNHCAGSAYYGRSYPSQVDSYVAVISEGWTNAAPPLPPSTTWTGPAGFPGLPPLS
jgi:hypothetical protein